MPILQDWVPNVTKNVMAEKIMAKQVKKLNRVENLAKIAKALKTSHHGFPVVNESGKCIGLIPSNFILVILSCH